MIKFIKTKETGTLIVDRVLFETFIPILFVCENENKELFICVCHHTQNDQRSWLVAKTTADLIIQLLTDKITLRQIFTTDPTIRLTITKTNKKTDIYHNEDDWLEYSPKLPAEAYLDADGDEYAEDIAYYKNKKYSKKIKKNLESYLL